MTCREKLMKDKPDGVNDMYAGGCYGCPHTYGYLPKPSYCTPGNTCNDCCDREIPEETFPICNELKEVGIDTPEKLHKAIDSVSDAFQRAGENAVKAGKAISSIKDSGDRTQFESGAVRDMREGKGRCDLMPMRVAAMVVGGDPVLDYISMFKETGETGPLYVALRHFVSAFNGLADMLLEVAKHFEEGAKKYGENNWQKGIPVHCYIDSAVRHYLKWLRGDTDEPHDRAFVWNLMCCIWEVDYHDYRPEEIQTEGRGVMPSKSSEDEAEVGCDRCRGTYWTDETFHVINPHGIAHNVIFEFCPVCGRKLPKPKEKA